MDQESKSPEKTKKDPRLQKKADKKPITKAGQFQPGNTFGKGRAEGSKSHKQLALEKIGFDVAQDIYANVAEMAKQGDWKAMQFILSRTVPETKNTYVEIKIPDAGSLKGINEASLEVIRQMASGGISIEVGTALMNSLDKRRECQETLEIHQALKELQDDIIVNGKIESIADRLKLREYSDDQVKVLFDSIKDIIDRRKKTKPPSTT
jgi:hypothetical protein